MIRDIPCAWQPIETAPLETPILLFVPEFEYFEPSDQRVMATRHSHGGVSYWSIINDGNRGGLTVTPPTHWMPLPDPPASTIEAGTIGA
jgi:hypothetical protein